MLFPFLLFRFRGLHRWLACGALGSALGWGHPLQAQQLAVADTAARTAAVAAARQAYGRALGTEAMLYNGLEYVDYTLPGTSGHQFFLSADPQNGAVSYLGGYYVDVRLRYDIVRDQPVLLYPGKSVAVALPADKVAGFALGERQFVRVVADTLTADLLPTGYYEVLVDGPVRLLARHAKRAFQTAVNQTLEVEYRENDQLLVRTPTAVAEVTSLRKLLARLPAHQAEVQRFARQHRLKFGKAERAASATQALRYYYTLAR